MRTGCVTVCGRGMWMPDSFTIRQAVAADGPACAAIVDAWVSATPWMPRTISLAELEVALTEGLPKREAWVIGDPVAGYLSMDPADNHIWGLYAAKKSVGLGKRLMDHVKEGRERLQLNTHLSNTRAHAFYAREGFVRVGEPWEGGDGIPEIRMEWRVDG